VEEIEEYKEGMKRSSSCSDMGSVKSEVSKTKSVEIAEAVVTPTTVPNTPLSEELKAEDSDETKKKPNQAKVKVEELEEEPASNETQDTVLVE